MADIQKQWAVLQLINPSSCLCIMLCLSSDSYLIIALFSWIYTNSRRLFLIYSTLTALNTTSIQNMDAEMFKHASDV